MENEKIREVWKILLEEEEADEETTWNEDIAEWRKFEDDLIFNAKGEKEN